MMWAAPAASWASTIRSTVNFSSLAGVVADPVFDLRGGEPVGVDKFGRQGDAVVFLGQVFGVGRPQDAVARRARDVVDRRAPQFVEVEFAMSLDGVQRSWCGKGVHFGAAHEPA